MNRDILQGDILERIKDIPDNTIDCIITSPPYWGLRDYGAKGQLGLEPDFRDFLKIMSKIMIECKRVLKDTGSCWVNLGDTYAGSGKGAGGDGKESFVFDKKPEVNETIQAKSQIGIPARFYINCIDEGWIARNFIPWIKGNAMPSSVKDNLTNKWEAVFFFVKNNKPVFWYNEITFESVTEQPKGNKGGIDWIYKTCTICLDKGINKNHKKCNGTGIFRYTTWHSRDYYFNLDNIREETISEPRKIKNVKTKHEQGTLDGGIDKDKFIDKKYGDDSKINAGRLHTSDARKNKAQDQYTRRMLDERAKGGQHDNPLGDPKGKNPGNVFYINTQAYSGAHFATFPEKLPMRILKCACPSEVCRKCNIPRYPISKPSPEYQKIIDKQFLKEYGASDGMKTGGGIRGDKGAPRPSAEYVLAGYSKCNCNEGFKPGIVLDPFMGAGTTALAAEKLGLDWMGIELNEEYIVSIRKRLENFKNNKMGDYS